MRNSHLKTVVPGEQGSQQGNDQKALPRFDRMPTRRADILKQETFRAMLALERRRAERSRKPFVLMLLDSSAVHTNRGAVLVERLASVVSDAIRESDLVGWYQEGVVLAVIFTEVSLDGNCVNTEVLHSKVARALRENLDHTLASKLVITVHLFPESWDKDHPDRVADLKLYPDVSERDAKKRFPTVIKRGMDIVGSGTLLLILSPVLAAIAVAIKLTSKGPVIFRQDRLGQFGKSFQCLKFRTMCADNDPKIHREYVQNFIAGKVQQEYKNEARPVIYKIKNDPRLTPIGRFLRKTSLDEFPQFWNVLRGEMSLVGPRPPVSYEFEAYDFWHRRRVFEVKPGVTGLWQVSGRSRTCFDEMVRMDLRYSQRWSLWLDLKILLATPSVVFRGDGAY
jgi:exopolysaccharide biosynthesis polyprenyl glycosylphosphotransferase